MLHLLECCFWFIQIFSTQMNFKWLVYSVGPHLYKNHLNNAAINMHSHTNLPCEYKYTLHIAYLHLYLFSKINSNWRNQNWSDVYNLWQNTEHAECAKKDAFVMEPILSM